MIIFDLTYLEELSELPKILAGGSCFVSVSVVSGKIKVKKSKGCGPVKKEVKSKGPTTTYTYKAKDSTVSITSSTGKSANNISVVSSTGSFWDSEDWDDW